MSQRSLRDATIAISAGGANIVVKIGEGNFNFTERTNIEYIRNRGVIDTVRLGDDEPVDVSFDFVWEWITSASLSTDTDSIRDILRGDGHTTTGQVCEPYACNIVVTITSCSITEVITLADFRQEEISYDLRNGTISCSGKCNISAATIA